MELRPGRPDHLLPVLLRWALIGMVSLILHRLIFLLAYGVQAFQLEAQLQEEGSVSALILAFITGIRFDLATLPIWIGPYSLLLSGLCGWFSIQHMTEPRANQFRFLTGVLFYSQWFWFLGLNLASVASTYNFSVNGKHIGWEFTAYFRDLPVLLAGSFVKDPVPTTLLTLFIPLWIFTGVIVDRKLHSKRIEFRRERSPAWKVISFPITILLIAVLFFRGGLQQNPLRPGDAMSQSSPFLNNLKLTGLYTIVHDLSDRGDFKTFYSEAENIHFVQHMLDNGRPFFNADYPLLREMEPRQLPASGRPGHFATSPAPKMSMSPPNILVLLLESWSARFLRAHGGEERIAPNFNRLTDQGVYFERFYASGGRSANGLFSILTGIPDRAGRTILRSPRIFNRFGALPYLLKQKGYATLFVHGGDLHFDNLDTGLPHLGFERLIGMKEMEASGRYQRRWTMGFHDEDMYDMLIRNLDELHSSGSGRPFFAMAFTSNNHHPYGLPDPSFEIFPPSDPEAAFKNSYHYSDFALGKLVDIIKSRPYFPNTIVLIVADHSHHANLDYLQDREIPFLVYGPAFFRPERRVDIAGQLDLLPTILALSGGNSPYAAMGRDLTDQIPADPFAFFAGGSNTDIIGMVRGGFIHYHYLRSAQSVLLKGTHPTDMRDLATENPGTFTALDTHTKHYYQFARSLEKENRIWPETLSQ